MEDLDRIRANPKSHYTYDGLADSDIEKLLNHITHLEDELKQAKQSSVDTFIDGLINRLESRGIDATDWDGEDDPAEIVANGIASVVEAKDKEIERIRYLHGFAIESHPRYQKLSLANQTLKEALELILPPILNRNFPGDTETTKALKALSDSTNPAEGELGDAKEQLAAKDKEIERVKALVEQHQAVYYEAGRHEAKLSLANQTLRSALMGVKRAFSTGAMRAMADQALNDSTNPTEGERWQPIETAPKVGRLLLWYDGIMVVGYWSESVWVKPGGSWIIYENRSDTVELTPTHWMPLPPSPQQLTGEKK